MNKNLRKTLDWIELPVTLYTFAKMNKSDKAKVKEQLENWSCEWRKNTYSFRIAKWFLNTIS
jgi:hypothetical protein